LIQYVKNIAPRAVSTSGKSSSAAGLTAAAVRDDFADGQQWTLEAGALVLADRGVAAVDELDKMDSSDRSALHEGLEQQQISVNKAGINATLKSRCSLLAAANPKYGRFDQHEKYSQQIDLEPALLSRFDIMFIITDVPDQEKDKELAEHIVQTNYAGEVYTHQQQNPTSNFSEDEVEKATEDVQSAIDPELMRKYIAFAKRNVFPTMTEEAKTVIEDFYVDLRSKGLDEGSAVPVTARKLEALVRLSEASARMRLGDHVEKRDAEKAVDIVMSSLKDVGVDPETGEFDADIVETGTSKSQRDRIKNIKALISEIQEEYEEGAPIEEVLDRAEEMGTERSTAEHEIEKLRQKGEVYEPQGGHLRSV
jgi:replicative DNA helicase Mcm